MRKWHRWLSVLFGVFLLWIALTGLVSQVPMWSEMFGGAGDDGPPAAALTQAAQPGFKCPETMVCRPRQQGGSWVKLVNHLHSGESFGPLGTLVATLSGLALVFFAFSGLWMYLAMWRNRRGRGQQPGWFWD